jgi:NADH-quinone oxidoreductase subunit J
METVFYISAAIAVLSTLMVVTRRNAVHALLYLIVSLLAVAVILFVLGGPMVAVLEVIVYAGAIMVLFVFVIIVLNIGHEAVRQERQWLRPGNWIGPALLTGVLAAELVYILAGRAAGVASGEQVSPAALGASLFGPYVLGVEMASLLLLAALVGAYHLGRRTTTRQEQGSDGIDKR